MSNRHAMNSYRLSWGTGRGGWEALRGRGEAVWQEGGAGRPRGPFLQSGWRRRGRWSDARRPEVHLPIEPATGQLLSVGGEGDVEAVAAFVMDVAQFAGVVGPEPDRTVQAERRQETAVAGEFELADQG